VRNCVDKYGGFNQCSSIVTDGVKKMAGEKKGFSGILGKSGIKCPIFHSIIHQEALYGKSVQQSNCMKVVVKSPILSGGVIDHFLIANFVNF
jgi:hypothetical protein